jgi:hypothetical protein
MAVPVFRGVGSVVVNPNTVVTPTNLTPTKNGSTVNGDLMVLFTACRSIVATVSTPTGWTVVSGFPLRSATASGGSIYIFTRTADGTANDAPTVSWASIGSTGTSGDSSSAVILSYRDLTATLSGSVPAKTDVSATTNWVTPSVTTADAEALVLTASIRVSDTAQTSTITFPATERVDNHTTNGTGHMLEVAEQETGAAGASGARTVTPSNTTAAQTLSVAIGLKPAADTPDNGLGPGHDAATASSITASGGSAPSFTHTPVGTPKGVLVYAIENAAASTITAEITGCTYGGIAMTQVANSPAQNTAATEDGLVYGFFLGSGIPTGIQTVTVQASGSVNQKVAVAITVSDPGTGTTRIAGTAALAGLASGGPFMEVDVNAGIRGSVVYGGLHTTDSTVATTTQPGQSYTEINEGDFGTQGYNVARRTLEGATGTIGVNWLHTGVGEAGGALAVAIEGVPSLALPHPVHHMTRLRR